MGVAHVRWQLFELLNLSSYVARAIEFAPVRHKLQQTARQRDGRRKEIASSQFEVSAPAIPVALLRLLCCVSFAAATLLLPITRH